MRSLLLSLLIGSSVVCANIGVGNGGGVGAGVGAGSGSYGGLGQNYGQNAGGYQPPQATGYQPPQVTGGQYNLPYGNNGGGYGGGVAAGSGGYGAGVAPGGGVYGPQPSGGGISAGMGQGRVYRSVGAGNGGGVGVSGGSGVATGVGASGGGGFGQHQGGVGIGGGAYNPQPQHTGVGIGVGAGSQPRPSGSGVGVGSGRVRRYSTPYELYRRHCNRQYGKLICFRLYNDHVEVPADFTCWEVAGGKKNCTEKENVLFLQRLGITVDPAAVARRFSSQPRFVNIDAASMRERKPHRHEHHTTEEHAFRVPLHRVPAPFEMFNIVGQ